MGRGPMAAWRRRAGWIGNALLGACLTAMAAHAQEAAPVVPKDEPPAAAATAAQPAAPEAADYVVFNFPEPIEIRELVDYVSRRTGAQFLYDETLSGKVMLRSPSRVPIQSVPNLLASILRFKGYTLIEREGWKRITKIQGLPTEAPIGIPGKLPTDEAPVTVVVNMKKADATKVLNAVKPLLSQPGGNGFVVTEINGLILTDFSSNLARVGELVALLDVERPTVQLESFKVSKTLPSKIAPVLKEIVGALDQAREKAGGAPPLAPLRILESDRTGELLVITGADMIETLRPVIARLDSATGRTMRTYRIEHLDAAKAIETLEKVFSGLDEGFKATFVRLAASNTVIVVASPEAQAAVAETLKMLDVARDQPGELQFYEVGNMPADDMKQMLTQIYGGDPAAAGIVMVVDAGMNTLICRASKEEHVTLKRLVERLDRKRDLEGGGLRFYRLQNTDAESLATTLKEVFAQGGVSLVDNSQMRAAVEGDFGGYSGARIGSDAKPAATPGIDQPPAAAPPVTPRVQKTQGGAVQSEILISVDRNTNSLIINAPYRLHQSIQEVIAQLDQRRPQVLVEIRVISISHSGEFNLGVELMSNGLDKDKPQLFFSNFGLSKIDTTTGVRTLSATSQGISGFIVGGKDLTTIFHALQTELNAKVLAAPRLLINDNAEGTIRSVSEQPYTAINTAQTVATTSFAGYAEAGTWMSVVPHISRANYIRLKYKINRSGFRGTGTDTSPPPRDSDEVESEVTIPDGYAVIVGGLNNAQQGRTISRIPYAGSIPLIGVLFRLFDKTESQSTMYVFIKTTILRDDTFEDLRWLSQKYLTESDESSADGIGAIYPPAPLERMVPANAP